MFVVYVISVVFVISVISVGNLSQKSAARNPQPGIFSGQSPTNLCGVRAGDIGTSTA